MTGMLMSRGLMVMTALKASGVISVFCLIATDPTSVKLLTNLYGFRVVSIVDGDDDVVYEGECQEQAMQTALEYEGQFWITIVMPKCIAYYRVSTQRQGQSGLGRRMPSATLSPAMTSSLNSPRLKAARR